MNFYKLKGTSGNVINRSFPIGDSLLLGSSLDCDVQIEGDGVSPRHAEINLLDDQTLMLKDLGSGAGTLLNGERVEQAMLSSGDEIRIGTCRWMLQAPGLRPERVLTAAAVQASQRQWPRILVWTSLAAVATAVAVLKWKPEWLGLF